MPVVESVVHKGACSCYRALRQDGAAVWWFVIFSQSAELQVRCFWVVRSKSSGKEGSQCLGLLFFSRYIKIFRTVLPADSFLK